MILPYKAVYSYFFPEVRAFARTAMPNEFYLSDKSHTQISSMLFSYFGEMIEFPCVEKFALDEIHIPLLNLIIDAYSEFVPKLNEFPNVYPTSGSSEGIFHLLSEFATNRGIKQINVFEGEYEGYMHYARSLGMKVNIIMEDDDDHPFFSRPLDGVWFISNPSSLDGGVINNNIIEDLCETGNKIVLDFAYLGLTEPYKFFVDHKNIIAVVSSMSKPYGMFRFRIGGMCLTRDPFETLIGNKWFKDVNGIITAARLVQEIPPFSLYSRYKIWQDIAVSVINEDLGGEVLYPSDVLLLAAAERKTVEQFDNHGEFPFEIYRRSKNMYRFCLTPYFEQRESVERFY